MSIKNRIVFQLNKMDYRKLETNSEDIALFYQSNDTKAYIVTLFSLYSGDEINIERYERLIQQINSMFDNMNQKENQLLSIILTANPYKVRGLCLDTDCHWVIDLNENRLLIYENQQSEFNGIKNELEMVLYEAGMGVNNTSQNNEMNIEPEPDKTGNTDSNWTRGPGNTDSNWTRDYDNTNYDWSEGYENVDSNWTRGTENADSNWNGTHGQFNPGSVVHGHTKRPGWVTFINTSIIMINILVFIFIQQTSIFGETEKAMTGGALSWYGVVKEGEYYRVFTSMFLHSDFSHLANNMLVLFFVGDNLERAAGKARYILIYFGSGIIAGISSIVYNMRNDDIYIYTLSVGASGAIFGIVGAMVYILIINKGHLEDISIIQIVLFAAFSLYGGFTSVNVDNAGHIGGFVAGLILAIVFYRKQKVIKSQGNNNN